jgi:hypothetical protein
MKQEDDDLQGGADDAGRRRSLGLLERAAGVRALEARVAELEARLNGMESAHVRFAELLDLVQELLLPVAQRDEAKVAALVEQFTDDLDTAAPARDR